MKEPTSKKNMTRKQSSIQPLDRISELPSNIAHSILMLLPLRDMARTSVLSKHWRYQWVKVPQLRFEDDPNYPVSQEEKYRYNGKRVFEILLKHEGPILSFYLNMRAWPTCTEVDSIIPFLSKNGIQKLTILMPNNTAERYKLSSSIFSSLNLRHLGLSSCVLQPSSFVAFNNLVSLALLNVELDPSVSVSSCPCLESLSLYDILTVVKVLNVDAPNLKSLHFEGEVTRIGIVNTPLLIELQLSALSQCYIGNCSSDLMSLLLSLPLLERLYVDHRFLQVLAVGDYPGKLPKLLRNLRMLKFKGVDLCHMDELKSALWFIRSSPSLRTLTFGLWKTVASSVEAELYLKMHDRSDYSLIKLQEVEMILSTTSGDMGLVMEFSKFLLDISPALEMLCIEPDSEHIDVDGYKKLLELACLPRASPKAKIVYNGLESLNIALRSP